MKKIVHVTTAHPVRDNRIFRKECTALANAGFDVTLVAVHDNDERLGQVSVAALPRRAGRIARMGVGPLDAWKKIRELRPDVLHGHDPELIPLLVAYRLSHRSARVIFDAHENLPKQVAGKPYLPKAVRPLVAGGARTLERLADRVLDAVVVATPHIQESFTAQKTVLVQNYPWLRDYPEPEAYPQQNDPTKLVYVGAISRGRGSEIMGDLPSATTPRTQLVAAGILASDAETDFDKSKPGVDFRGKLSADEVPALISDSNIGLSILLPLPNYLEAQATKIFEYMAAARPFVASNFPYWKALFNKYDCGLFVDPENQASVVSAIELLTSDPARARTMGLNGRKAIEADFSFENEALKLVVLYETLTTK